MGGGSIRTVAKAAAFGTYRSPAIFSGAEPSSAASMAPRNSSAAVPVVSLSASSSKGPAPEASPRQRPVWDLDDWEFADWPEEGKEAVVEALRPPAAPRVVFGPVPTLEEAKEATSDLKDALDKVYFSGATTSTPGKEALAIVLPWPNHVAQTFSLLQKSPEAQEIVASLAADKIIWNAVMNNPKVMEFYKNHESKETSWQSWESPTASTAESSTKDGSSEPGFAGFWQNVKLQMQKTVARVEEMVQNSRAKMKEVFLSTKDRVEQMASDISTFFEDLFGASTENSRLNTVGPSFVALAIAVILVILVKRSG